MKTKQFKHQREEYENFRDARSRALLWTMRTGKSKAVIDNACDLADWGQIDAVLVLAPNNVHRNWVRRELKFHSWDSIPYQGLAWNTTNYTGNWSTKAEQARGEVWREDFKRLMHTSSLPWLSVNTESLALDPTKEAIARFIRGRRYLLVADEMQDFGRAGSKWTKPAIALSRKASYVRGLTGSPVANSPLRAYGQFELMAKGALGFNRYADFEAYHAEFQRAYGRGGNKYDKVKAYRNLDELAVRIAKWSSLVRREDCPDLPSLVSSRREFEPTKEQVRVYRQLHDEFRAWVEDEEVISFVEAGARFTKLVQVMSGFVKGSDGTIHDLGPNPRLDVLSTEVDLCPGQVVVWCAFREDCRRVAERLRRDGHSVGEYHGGVGSAVRERAEDELRAGTIRALVAQPHAGGRGLNFSAARDMIWYSQISDAEKRIQANDRCTQMGGVSTGVVDICAVGSMDEYILDVMMPSKESAADMTSGSGLKRAIREMLDATAL